VKGVLLSLLVVELVVSIVELQSESCKLLLKEVNRSLVLSHSRLKSVDLTVGLVQLGIEINNELISGADHLMVGLSQFS